MAVTVVQPKIDCDKTLTVSELWGDGVTAAVTYVSGLSCDADDVLFSCTDVDSHTL